MTPRLTLVTILALGTVALAACGSKEGSSGPAVVPGEAAGDVREVTGSVTAQRGDEPARALAVGDVVAGDDLIATAAGSSIVIELRHNGVRWSLAAERSTRLGESAAWNAPRRAGAGGATDERSTAAGRHAEREAADTAASAAMAESAAAPDPKPAPDPAPPPPAAPEPERAPASDEDAPKRKTARKADKLAEKPKGLGGGSVGTGIGAGGIGDGGDRPKPVREPVKITARLDEVLPAEAKRTVAARMSTLRACWQRAADDGAREGLLAARLTVDPDGKVTEVVIGKAAGDLDRALDCLKAQLRRMTFSDTPDTTVSVKATFGIE